MLKVYHSSIKSFLNVYNRRDKKSEVFAGWEYLTFLCKNEVATELHFCRSTKKELDSFCMREKIALPPVIEIDGEIAESRIGYKEVNV